MGWMTFSDETTSRDSERRLNEMTRVRLQSRTHVVDEMETKCETESVLVILAMRMLAIRTL